MTDENVVSAPPAPESSENVVSTPPAPAPLDPGLGEAMMHNPALAKLIQDHNPGLVVPGFQVEELGAPATRRPQIPQAAVAVVSQPAQAPQSPAMGDLISQMKEVSLANEKAALEMVGDGYSLITIYEIAGLLHLRTGQTKTIGNLLFCRVDSLKVAVVLPPSK